VIRSLVASTARLRDFPESGRLVEERAKEGVREIVVRPYLIAYRPEGNEIEILRVWHGKKMLWPEELEE
jgi:plasmid stabilization system protein ParE